MEQSHCKVISYTCGSPAYLLLLVVPETPSRDANGHDDEEDHLGKENEEERKEVEGAVTPRERKT